MEKRQANTISDVVDLLGACNAKIELREGAIVTFSCQPTDEELAEAEKASKENDWPVGDLDEKSGVAMRRQTANVVRSLVGSPVFWRYTTLCDHLGHFARRPAGKAAGIIKSYKRAKEPMTFQFDSEESAAQFFAAIKNSRNFKEI